ncbi:MAG TPA: hypothetical protein VJ124_06620 [Pyrinomonadaceae bacterium]|nr:hypothetical protein [Pyrinomonadaceae bacterium]
MRKISWVTAGGRSLFALLLATAACNGTRAAGNKVAQQTPVQSSNQSGELRYKAPEGWANEKPTSSMRAAQYKLPRAAGDSEDASLVLYYFGPGQGGSVSANIDRWIGQMAQPDGSSSGDKAKTESLEVNGLQVSMVDVSGTYTAEMTPGSGTRENRSDYRLRAAVIETPKGAYFVKLIGPAKTVNYWDQAFLDYVKSFEFK